uniref:Uncharacterized protein n=1 Tax=Leersia perrieri TaxID=77586 RepID=A0A0D9VPS2_9ORYZ
MLHAAAAHLVAARAVPCTVSCHPLQLRSTLANQPRRILAAFDQKLRQAGPSDDVDIRARTGPGSASHLPHRPTRTMTSPWPCPLPRESRRGHETRATRPRFRPTCRARAKPLPRAAVCRCPALVVRAARSNPAPDGYARALPITAAVRRCLFPRCTAAMLDTHA